MIKRFPLYSHQLLTGVESREKLANAYLALRPCHEYTVRIRLNAPGTGCGQNEDAASKLAPLPTRGSGGLAPHDGSGSLSTGGSRDYRANLSSFSTIVVAPATAPPSLDRACVLQAGLDHVHLPLPGVADGEVQRRGALARLGVEDHEGSPAGGDARRLAPSKNG